MRLAVLLAATAALLGAMPAQAADDPIDLATVTCATARKEGEAVTPRMLTSAVAGRLTALGKRTVYSPDYDKAVGEALKRGCDGSDGAGRKLVDIASGVAVPAKGAKDRDFATMTCAQLGPLWKEEARQLVPFLVALRDTATNAPLTKAGLDKVGEGLPRLCKEAGNSGKLVTELVAGLK